MFFERWHTTLIMWFIVGMTYTINVWAIRIFPMTELLTGILHLALFVALVVPMVVLGRNSSAEFVFTTYINEAGWESDGVAWFIGLLPCV